VTTRSTARAGNVFQSLTQLSDFAGDLSSFARTSR
jgi:hypothetical protein